MENNTELHQAYQSALLSAGVPANLASECASVLVKDDQPFWGGCGVWGAGCRGQALTPKTLGYQALSFRAIVWVGVALPIQDHPYTPHPIPHTLRAAHDPTQPDLGRSQQDQHLINSSMTWMTAKGFFDEKPGS